MLVSQPGVLPRMNSFETHRGRSGTGIAGRFLRFPLLITIPSYLDKPTHLSLVLRGRVSILSHPPTLHSGLHLDIWLVTEHEIIVSLKLIFL
jgi:hypothetical protein